MPQPCSRGEVKGGCSSCSCLMTTVDGRRLTPGGRRRTEGQGRCSSVWMKFVNGLSREVMPTSWLRDSAPGTVGSSRSYMYVLRGRLLSGLLDRDSACASSKAMSWHEDACLSGRCGPALDPRCVCGVVSPEPKGRSRSQGSGTWCKVVSLRVWTVHALIPTHGLRPLGRVDGQDDLTLRASAHGGPALCAGA